jgi:DNA-binding MarR family transcriptional regulator
MMYMHHIDSPSAEAACVCGSLRKASRAVTRMYDEVMEETGMTIMQFSILRNLARNGETPLMRLAKALVMERTTLYRALAPIERRGWVGFGDGEGRAKTVFLTEQGRAALEQAGPAWRLAQKNLLDGMGVANWRALEAGLARLVKLTRKA